MGKRCGAARSSSLWTTASSPPCCGASANACRPGWRRWKSPRRLRRSHDPRVDGGGDLPAQGRRDAVQLALGVAVLHYLALAEEGAPVAADAADRLLGRPVQGQARHEGAELHQPRGGILQSPAESAAPGGRPLPAAGACESRPCCVRRSPDHAKVAGGELRQRLPAADVGADGRVGFEQLQQAAHRFPCRAGRPARRPRPRRRSSRPA